jgi:excisionase family DNA binding protein
MPHDPLHPPRLLEVHEVAYQLKSSQETVLRLIRKKKIAAIRLGNRSWRVDPIDLQAFIDAQRVAADGVDPAADTRRRRDGGDA